MPAPAFAPAPEVAFPEPTDWGTGFDEFGETPNTSAPSFGAAPPADAAVPVGSTGHATATTTAQVCGW